MLFVTWFEQSRATPVFEILAISLLGVVVFQILSVASVKLFKRYWLHKVLQILVTIAVLILVALLEWEVRVHGWKHLAIESPYYQNILIPFLVFHIVCALATFLFWSIALYQAFKNFAHPPRPNSFSPQHRLQVRLAMASLGSTILTGWAFFYLAFLA